MRAWLLAVLVVGLFAPAACSRRSPHSQEVPKADNDATNGPPLSKGLEKEKPKPEPFSFRDVKFGTRVEEIPGLVKRREWKTPGEHFTETNCLQWYVREYEKPINGVNVEVYFGFYKGKLTEIVIDSLSSMGDILRPEVMLDIDAIDQALKKKYGNPQPAADICKKGAVKLLEGQDFIQVETTNGPWAEWFPSPTPASVDDAREHMRALIEGRQPPPLEGSLSPRYWWLFNDRVLMTNNLMGCSIEIKDVPLLIEGMKSAEQEYREQVDKAAEKAAKNDF